MNQITEKNNPLSLNIDEYSIIKILNVINNEDSTIHKKIKYILPKIEILIKNVINSFNNEGKLIYIGCGTSGRLGVLDAAECPPTFSTKHDLVQCIIAGGNDAMFKSIENAEDSVEEAINKVEQIVSKNDTVIGISASGKAKFVLSALNAAKRINAKTYLITCNDVKKISYIDLIIPIIVGPEIITGSTRMKAGTATKMILNMISTVSMIKINKTYANLMVDLQVSNNKLLQRGIKIISEITNLSYTDADISLKKAEGNVKVAIIMVCLNINKEKAISLLKEHKGNLKRVIN